MDLLTITRDCIGEYRPKVFPASYSNQPILAEEKSDSVPDFWHIKPEGTSLYPAANPSTEKPIIAWTIVPGAVYYEIELLSAPPESPNNITPSIYQIGCSRELFTHGYTPGLSLN